MLHSIYKPKNFDQLDFNTLLSNIELTQDFPHMIIYGPKGTGKKTRIKLLLDKFYPKYKLSEKLIVWKVKGEVPLYISNYHYWIDCNTLRSYEKQILSSYIKNIGTSNSICHNKFKFIIFENAEILSEIAQAMLRRMIEKYSDKIRFIFILGNISKLNPILQSRCCLIRNSAPSDEVCYYIIQKIVDMEGYKISKRNLSKLLIRSKDTYGYNNLWYIIHLLELSCCSCKKISHSKTGFDIKVDELIKLLLNKEYNFIQIRILLYEFDISNINLILLLNRLLSFFIKHIKSDMRKYKLIKLISDAELLINKCNKKVIALEKTTLELHLFIHYFK